MTVYEKIYWKLAGQTQWNLMFTTPEHTINDCEPHDADSLIVGFTGSCSGYDFKVEVWRSGQSSPDDIRDSSNDADLAAYPLEGAAEDTVAATITDAWWTNEVDQDGDGCVRSATLNWEPDAVGCSGSMLVYEMVYYRQAGFPDWTFYTMTDVHTIDGCSPDDQQALDVTLDVVCDDYDFRIEIYRGDDPGMPDDTRDSDNDSDLNDYRMEDATDDEGCCPCTGDLTQPCDNVVNVTDFTLFAAAYGSSFGDPEYNPCADLAPAGGDGVINVTDFTVFAGQYGQPCP